MKSMLRTCHDGDMRYECLAFVCPGCVASGHHETGLHILPVNTTSKSPSWTWDGNLEAPTLSPSILTFKDEPYRCHSLLKAGVFEFLADSMHSLAGQNVPMPDLPDWFTHEGESETETEE